MRLLLEIASEIFNGVTFGVILGIWLLYLLGFL